MTAITMPASPTEASPAQSSSAAPAAALTVRMLTPDDRSACATFVERARPATLFHHPDWCDAIAAAFPHAPRHLGAWRGPRLVGVLPLFELRSIFAGRLLVSSPCSAAGGVLAADDQAADDLLAAAIDLAGRRRAAVLELRSPTPRFPQLSGDDRYVTFARHLPLRVDELAGFLPRKARAAARQARERDGLEVRHDDRRDDLVWRLYARSMRRLASLAYPPAFFEALAASHPRRTWCTFVYAGPRPVAAVLSFIFRDTVLPYFAGIDERCRATGVGNLLYLGVMERAVRAGLRRFDFGRTRRDNRGAYTFKKNQGFDPEPLGYQRYVAPGRRAPDLTPGNPRFALARRCWPRLPLGIANPLGAWLSRSLPG